MSKDTSRDRKWLRICLSPSRPDDQTLMDQSSEPSTRCRPAYVPLVQMTGRPGMIGTSKRFRPAGSPRTNL